ncbi:MAG: hypothetical protein RMK00_09400 [Bacteroidota bacterium]|nr:hypothetical protein [Bacteroidota bacterium]
MYDWNTRVGISFKQIRAAQHTLLTDNPRTPYKEQWRSEIGFENSSTFRARIDSALTLHTKLDIRSLWSPQPQWTGQWNTEFIHQLWSIFEMRASIQLSYDPQQSKRVQYRQTIALGISMKW